MTAAIATPIVKFILYDKCMIQGKYHETNSLYT